MDELDTFLTELSAPATAPDAPAPAASDDGALVASEDTPPDVTETDGSGPETATDPATDAATPEGQQEAAADPDGTPPADVVPEAQPVQTAPPANPELDQLRQTIAHQQQLLAAWQQAQAQQQAKAQWDQLQAQWAEMDPEDAAKSREQFLVATFQQDRQQLVGRLQQLEAQRVAEQQAAENAAAKPLVIDHFITTYKLSDGDRATLNLFDDPQRMEAFAQQLQAQRQAQTQQARAARAQQISDGKAFVSTGGQAGAAPPTPKEYATLDDLLADVLSA